MVHESARLPGDDLDPGHVVTGPKKDNGTPMLCWALGYNDGSCTRPSLFVSQVSQASPAALPISKDASGMPMCCSLYGLMSFVCQVHITRKHAHHGFFSSLSYRWGRASCRMDISEATSALGAVCTCSLCMHLRYIISLPHLPLFLPQAAVQKSPQAT